MKRNKGFTLIELLVVIAIIAVLATLALAGVSGAQRQARDTQRRNDLNNYRIALESYSAANSGNYLVQATAATFTTTNALGVGMTGNMTSILIDSKSSNTTCLAADYNYCYIGNADQYVLWGKLETGGYWEICDVNSQGGKAGKVGALPANVTCDVP